MRPSDRYRQLAPQLELRPDAAQQQALDRLDALQSRVLAARRWFSRRKPVQGLYLWGPVGTGKSLLADVFFDSLPEIGKTRLHYQHFMARVQRELNATRGVANPLQEIGRRLALEYRVICLDELHLTDLGDAMIVYNLFASLFREGVVLLITSNFAPEQLYKDDLQPAIFQPAIQLIRAHTEAFCLDGGVDYRRREAVPHPTWFVGEDEGAFAVLFDALNADLQDSSEFDTRPLLIQGHPLQPLRRHGSLAWFSFAELCEKPRSARDYLLLADQFSHLLLSGVPQFGTADSAPTLAVGTEDGPGGGQRRHFSSSENAQRRFINLVDECYDRGLKLYLQSAVALQEIYTGGRQAFEFQRTLSRLTEMQTLGYRERPLRQVEPSSLPASQLRQAASTAGQAAAFEGQAAASEGQIAASEGQAAAPRGQVAALKEQTTAPEEQATPPRQQAEASAVTGASPAEQTS